MLADDPLADRQSQAAASGLRGGGIRILPRAHTVRACVIRPIEAFAQMRQVFRGDTGPIVGNLQPYAGNIVVAAVSATQAYLRATTCPVFQGISTMFVSMRVRGP